MVRPVRYTGFFLIAITMMLSACRQSTGRVDLEGIEAEVGLERFDQELISLRDEAMGPGLARLQERYGDFFDIFNIHILQIGDPSERLYTSYLSMFLNDPNNTELFDYTTALFQDSRALEERISYGFRHYLYYYPDSTLPRIVGYVSGFNQGLFTVGSFVGVGLDQYLGSSCDFYRQMGVPRYLLPNKNPERIPLDVMLAWASSRFPYDDSSDNVLNRMIYKGMLRWFLGRMYPNTGDGEIMGFSEDQMNWCRNNEKQMWTYLVENKLLFESDPMTIRKLTEDAPHTQYFTIESPGRAANWQGLMIVRDFVKRNSRLSLPDIMAMQDYQQILRESRYNP